MRYEYPAIFTHEDNNVLVSVPDLKGLHTYADSMVDALYMAQDAIEMWLWDAEKNGEAIPVASSASELESRCKPHQTVSVVAADTNEYRMQNNLCYARA